MEFIQLIRKTASLIRNFEFWTRFQTPSLLNESVFNPQRKYNDDGRITKSLYAGPTAVIAGIQNKFLKEPKR